MTSETFFRQIYSDLLLKGQVVSPRGLKVLEIENYNYIVPAYVRFANFKSRKLNIGYIKQEFLWYLKGNKFDTSIAQHAKMWNNFINADGSINSNYGNYIFAELKQFDIVVNILLRDKESRRASIIILQSQHLDSLYDVPCTYSFNFRIRKDKLNMTIRMRSQDAYLGMSSDIPCFSFIHEMVLHTLKEYYLDLTIGEYYHSADSFHLYEKNLVTVNKMIAGDEFIEYDCPRIHDHNEVKFLRKLDFTNIPDNYLFTKWLIEK